MRRAPRLPTLPVCVLVATALIVPSLPTVSFAQPEASPVTVESVSVEPSDPGPDTLCKLSVRLANADDRIASQLGFRVAINGQELPVYGNQLFMYPVEAGSSSEIPLYNFWSTETSRPMPADGKLDIEVSLTEAEWMDISVDDEGVEVWTPLGAVEGLPSTSSITLEMQGSG